jgi:predicted XRE-type DNA-binding protein
MSETHLPMHTEFEVVRNIFEALDLPNAEGETARCELVGRIFKIGRDRNLSDRQLAELAGCTYERMAQLHAVEFDDVTIDELCRSPSQSDRPRTLLPLREQPIAESSFFHHAP